MIMVTTLAPIVGSATPKAMPGVAGRQQGIDALRFLLCFPVALLHTMPGSEVGAPAMWVVIAASACRSAVPFFFIASGYFARIPDRISWSIVSRPALRILPVYLLWMMIYYFIEYAQTGRITHTGWHDLLTGGDAGHLWFLPALIIAMIVVPVLLVTVGRVVTWLVCVAIAIINLAVVGYHLVLHMPEIAGRHAMIAPLLFLMGIELARRPPGVKLPLATVAILAAWALTLAEEAMIAHLSGTQLYAHASVATTYLFGLATFLFAKSLPNNKLVMLLARFGYLTLGIYASHLMFVLSFRALIHPVTLPMALTTAAAAIAAATALCLLLVRIRLTRRFIQ